MPALSQVRLAHRQSLNEIVVERMREPKHKIYPPGVYVRALRAYMRMSQRQLAKRCRIGQAHISRIERGRIDPGFRTWQRLFDALFCDTLVIPLPRKRPSEALGERLTRGNPFRDRHSPWDEKNARIGL